MANTVTYKSPVAGVTPPTAAQMLKHQSVVGTITGDNAATTAVITHNFGLSTAQLAAGLPWVFFEPLLAAYYTANPAVTAQDANTVTITTVAFTGLAIKFVVLRYSPLN